MTPERRTEIDMLYRNAKHDDKFLLYLLEDYLRLREYNEEGRVGAALEECRRLLRAIREKHESEVKG
jgi:hypothetical protein